MYKTEIEIEEMYNQHKYLIDVTLKRQYPNYHDFAKSHGLEVDDLLQLGGIGLYKAIKDYNPLFNASFETYAINKIKYAFMTETKMYSIRNESNRTFKFSGECSLETPKHGKDGEETTLYDTIEEATNFIEDAELNLLIDNIAKNVSPNLATAVKMKYENYTFKQIGEIINMSPQGVEQMLMRNRKKLSELMFA